MSIEQYHQPTTALSEQIEYARAVQTAALLPAAYRGKPADIMLAVGLGQSMGLSPAESLYRIDVIQGKPTASAELIAANVRKAGHKLRLRVDEAAVSATCTIIRADDPDYEHTVTRDRKWAQEMGLLGKDNYKKQPATMLGWRAVTACARMACPEALYGVAYTADEMGDLPEPHRGGGLSAALNDPPAVIAEHIPDSDPEAAPDVPASVSERPPASGSDSPLLDTRSALAKAMFAAMRERGIDDKDDRLRFCSDVTGREITTSAELTEDEARLVLRNLDPSGGAA